MSFGKGKSTTKTNESFTNATRYDPAVVGLATNNYNAASQLGQQLAQPYTGERVAGFTGDQLAAQAAARNIGAGSSPYTGAAADAAKSLLQYEPVKVGGQSYDPAHAFATNVRRKDVRDAAAGLLRDVDLSAYFNPYEDQVIGGLRDDFEYARRIQQQADAQRAQASRAFGSDRHGVAEALTNEAYFRNLGNAVANARYAGYDRATGLATGDLDRTLSADLANQAQDYAVAAGNADRGTQTALANAAAANRARELQAEQALSAQMANQQAAQGAAAVQQQAAGLLGSLSEQELQDQLLRLGLLNSSGDAQQALQQAVLDAAYEDFLRQQAGLATGQGLATTALGTIPVGTTQSGTSQGTSKTKTSEFGLDLAKLMSAGLFQTPGGN